MQNIHTFSICLLRPHPISHILPECKTPMQPHDAALYSGMGFIWVGMGCIWSNRERSHSHRTPIKGYSVDVRPMAQCQNALAISVSRRIISCGTEYFHVLWDCRQATVIQRRNEDPCTPACQGDLKEHTGDVLSDRIRHYSQSDYLLDSSSRFKLLPTEPKLQLCSKSTGIDVVILYDVQSLRLNGTEVTFQKVKLSAYCPLI